MRSPTNRSEETTWDEIANAYHDNREKAYKEELKTYKEELRVYRAFLWVAVIFCACCFFICWYGVHTFVEWDKEFSYYIVLETMLSEKRDQREIFRAKQDSIQDVRNEVKARRDSISWVRSNKAMDHYESLPDYKNER